MPNPIAVVPVYTPFLAIAAAFVSACGAAGVDWVTQPKTQPNELAPVASLSGSSHEQAVQRIPAAVDDEPTPEPRPRLAHSLTLGTVDDFASLPSAPGSNSSGGVSVTINNYNVSNAPSAGYGYVYSGRSTATPAHSPGPASFHAQTTNGPSPSIGQDWPAIYDPGPSFPYRSAPASPWSRTR